MKVFIYLIIATAMLFSSSITINLPVTHSEPIYRTVTKRVPYQECYDKTEQVRISCGNDSNQNMIGIDTLIGITAGVILGNQIGKGNGRSAAKVLGGIAGGLASNGMRDSSNNSCYEDRKRRVCETHYEQSISKRKIGYKLCAQIEANEICTSQKSKLSSIDVHVSAN